jgi:hypothetical protein
MLLKAVQRGPCSPQVQPSPAHTAHLCKSIQTPAGLVSTFQMQGAAATNFLSYATTTKEANTPIAATTADRDTPLLPLPFWRGGACPDGPEVWVAVP